MARLFSTTIPCLIIFGFLSTLLQHSSLIRVGDPPERSKIGVLQEHKRQKRRQQALTDGITEVEELKLELDPRNNQKANSRGEAKSTEGKRTQNTNIQLDTPGSKKLTLESDDLSEQSSARKTGEISTSDTKETVRLPEEKEVQSTSKNKRKRHKKNIESQNAEITQSAKMTLEEPSNESILENVSEDPPAQKQTAMQENAKSKKTIGSGEQKTTTPTVKYGDLKIYRAGRFIPMGQGTSVLSKDGTFVDGVLESSQPQTSSTQLFAGPKELQRNAQLVAPVDDNSLGDLLDGILTKWELQENPNAKSLLLQVWYKDNRYNPERDLVVFTHPLKTGGTSVSGVLNSLGPILPGSGESGPYNFHRHDYWLRLDQMHGRKAGNFNETDWWNQHKGLYGHTPYRSYGDTNVTTNNLLSFLEHKMPQKRVRHITMVREPLAFTASNFNEWQCRLGKWTKEAQKQKIPPIPEGTDYAGCDGYTLELLTQARVARNQEDCKHFTEATRKQFVETLRRRCIGARKNDGDHTPECASVDAFLNSPTYTQHFHHHDAYNRCTVQGNDHTPSRYFVEGAIQFLGGLDAPIKNGYPNGDMMWHGVTERMKDSMCLLHYQLRLPWEETPTKRIQKCRPVSYWKDSHRTKFYEKEPMMLAVHRAANAVLDVQLAKMRYEVANDISATDRTYIGAGCLVQDVSSA